MKYREKILIAVFGVLASFGILALILIYGMNFADTGLRLYGNELMEQLKNGNYGKMYEYFHEGYGKTAEQFIEQQKIMEEILGQMDSYRFARIEEKSSNLTLVYEAMFEKFPGSGINVLWSLANKSNRWEVLDYKIKSDSLTLHEINGKLAKLTLNALEAGSNDRIDLKSAAELADQVLRKYRAGEYRAIYSLGNSAFKSKGSEHQFEQYLSSAAARYGKPDSYELEKQETSKDGFETSLRYRLLCEKPESKPGLTVWIRMEDKLCLSGIKFVENSW